MEKIKFFRCSNYSDELRKLENDYENWQNSFKKSFKIKDRQLAVDESRVVLMVAYEVEDQESLVEIK